MGIMVIGTRVILLGDSRIGLIDDTKDRGQENLLRDKTLNLSLLANCSRKH